MCLPFLFFPSTITNSLSVLLLPAVAKAQSSGNRNQIERTCSVTIQFCLLIGLLSASVFFLLGNSFGSFFFHNELAGKYLSILAWLCPFLYLTSTLGSILNGLNKAGTTLFNTVTGVTIRLFFVIYCIPEKGMEGYLLGMLIGQLATFFLDIMAISKEIKINWNLWEWVAKPGMTLLCIGFLVSHFLAYVSAQNLLPELCTIVIAGLVLFFACMPYFYQCVKSA
jgi:stage V sporulation protein B